MANSTPSFQQYQRAFTAHIRDPIKQPRPSKVAARRMNVYKEIVFNNVFESVSACFPVAQKVIGKRAWQTLVRDFFSQHSANTPIFRKIPEEFLSYLSTRNCASQAKLPPYLFSLCHYEWVELLVSTMLDTTADVSLKTIPTGDFLAHKLAFTPTMQLLNYAYAVQKISPNYKPKAKTNTHLLVYRNADFLVKFIELNPATFKLMTLLQQEKITCEQALTIVANELANTSLESVMQFGLSLFNDLKNQGIILAYI